MKYVIYGLLVTLLGFVSSCADDKGNYDYQVINDTVENAVVNLEKIML